MVINLIDLLITHEYGNTALSIVKLANLKQGSILLECIFVLECSAPQNLQITRHLPPEVIRVVIDAECNDLTTLFEFDALTGAPLQLNKQIITQLIHNHQERLQAMFAKAEDIASNHCHTSTTIKIQQMTSDFDSEIQRLSALQKENPNIRVDEIKSLEQQQNNLNACMSKAYARMDSSRLIVAG